MEILCEDCRTPLERIAVMTGASLESVGQAIDEMEKDRVILQYSPIINWDRTDRERVEAMIEVKVTPQREAGFDQIADRVRNFDEVHSVYLIAGAYDFMVVIQGKTLREISHFVSEKLAIIEDVIATSTNFVLKKYKDHGVIFQTPSQDERLVIAP